MVNAKIGGAERGRVEATLDGNHAVPRLHHGGGGMATERLSMRMTRELEA